MLVRFALMLQYLKIIIHINSNIHLLFKDVTHKVSGEAIFVRLKFENKL